MRVGIFSPYLPKHYGGGEKHVLATAEFLSRQHEVTIFIPTSTENIEAAQAQYESFFDLDLSRVQWQPSTLADRTLKSWQIWSLTRQFDVFLYATDGSIFLSGAKKSILHVQIPFTNQHRGLWPRKKLNSWNVINTNSEFTKEVIESHWNTAVDVIHYPYVDTAQIPFSPDMRKQRQILAVGRFYDPEHTDVHAKRQDVLVETFKRGCKELGWDKRNWQLHLVGAVEPDSVHTAFVTRLKKAAQGFPIFFHHDISHTELSDLYAKSRFFWHAAGYGVDETTHPQKVEHFGMSTIEAMARGTLPVVTDKGGLKETVDHGENGFRFSTDDELLSYTHELMGLKTDERATWAQRARTKAEQFSLERFHHTIDQMLSM
ncbi:glycosyltransferase family 4 protein [Candidatus Woesebacteria bacterium]|nr:glycosyltransferase family 4 protein [Candidatus Woesebacteria bacterium]MCD8507175.1 glycosyltransferase family 4 protein [Candidatus Woesebacteria bacterium]MCD8527066.1 glycosyltransferase family 4 protein [Candidatus Woesebacteria bacterium]MCD8545932.1 glycosyltransferase family 4 protein [Candidatus Woesebacteria bacterium]